jgi:hypothetical protein
MYKSGNLSSAGLAGLIRVAGLPRTGRDSISGGHVFACRMSF